MPCSHTPLVFLTVTQIAHHYVFLIIFAHCPESDLLIHPNSVIGLLHRQRRPAVTLFSEQYQNIPHQQGSDTLPPSMKIASYRKSFSKSVSSAPSILILTLSLFQRISLSSSRISASVFSSTNMEISSIRLSAIALCGTIAATPITII